VGEHDAATFALAVQQAAVKVGKVDPPTVLDQQVDAIHARL